MPYWQSASGHVSPQRWLLLVLLKLRPVPEAEGSVTVGSVMVGSAALGSVTLGSLAMGRQSRRSSIKEISEKSMSSTDIDMRKRDELSGSHGGESMVEVDVSMPELDANE